MHRKPVVTALVLFVVLGSAAIAQTVYPRGTTIWDPGQTQPGLTFIPQPDGSADLISMGGQVVNHWSIGPDDTFFFVEPIPGSPGHILAFRNSVLSVPGYFRPRATVVTEYDGQGNVVFEYGPLEVEDFAGFHHDMERLPNGNTLLLCSFLTDVPWISPQTLIDDCIIEINPNGIPVWAWFTHEHFDEFGFTPVARQIISDSAGDWAHANSISVIPPNSHSDPAFAEGNIMVSYRSINTIVVIDRSTGQIVWKVGPTNPLTIGQHNAHMIPPGFPGAGNVLVFDNGGSGGYPQRFRDHSRILEIDPVAMSIAWEYTSADSGFQRWTLFSPIISGAQRLRNGNTLAVEGTKGRVFEVSEEGDIVWEYLTPVSGDGVDLGGKPITHVNLYRAFRLPLSWRR